MANNVNPWKTEIVTPSDYLISKFELWDKTKSSSSKRRAFQRAKKWTCDLLKLPFKISENR